MAKSKGDIDRSRRRLPPSFEARQYRVEITRAHMKIINSTAFIVTACKKKEAEKKELQYEFDKKQAIAKAEQEKKTPTLKGLKIFNISLLPGWQSFYW